MRCLRRNQAHSIPRYGYRFHIGNALLPRHSCAEPDGYLTASQRWNVPVRSVSARQLIDEPLTAVIPTALFSFNKMLVLLDASQAPTVHSSSSGKTIFNHRVLECVCNLVGWLGLVPPRISGIYCVGVEGMAEEPDLAKKLSMLARETLYSESPLLDARMGRHPVLSPSGVHMHASAGDSWQLFHTAHPYMTLADDRGALMLPASRISDALAAYHETRGQTL